jgi:hypothetical protein
LILKYRAFNSAVVHLDQAQGGIKLLDLVTPKFGKILAQFIFFSGNLFFEN